MDAEDLKYYSEEYHLPVEVIERENNEAEQFIDGLYATEPDITHDPEVVKSLMAQFTERAEMAVVPLIKAQYLYQSAWVAAMYIVKNRHYSDLLPPFYLEAMQNAESALSEACWSRAFIVLQILRIAGDDSIKAVKSHINQFNTIMRKYYSDSDIDSELYQQYEQICYRASHYFVWERDDLPRSAKISLLKLLTKQKGISFRMMAYAMLYDQYTSNVNIITAEDGSQDFADSEFNPKTDILYLEEYLKEAYDLAQIVSKDNGYAPFVHLVCKAIEVEYARWMYAPGLKLIPHNPEEADRILQEAAKIDNDYISVHALHNLDRAHNPSAYDSPKNPE